ncbi:MAG: tetratricopeptide repeat protein [Elusimicrobia bacterium]|nr:tetratricopeptide repeat protein [Elusimicrobiota bacterium]
MLQGALDAYFDNRFEDSVQLFQKILEVDPKNDAARKGLKNAQRKRDEQVRRERDQERKALYAAQEFVAHGKLVEGYDRVGDVLARSPNLPDAVELLKKIRVKADGALRKAKPGSSAFFEAEGVLAYMDEDWFKTVDSWEKVLVFNKDRLDLSQKIASAKKRLAEQQRQERIRVHLDLGQGLIQQGLFPDAIRALDEVLRMDPTNAEARTALYEARRLGAQAHKEEVAGHVQELNRKAMDAFTSGRRKEALAIFEKVLSLDPGNLLATDYKNRILGLDLAIDAPGPRAGGNGNVLGRAEEFFQNNRFQDGIEALERHLAQNPNDAKAQQLLDDGRNRQRQATDQAYREALTAYSRGDREGAMRKLQDCLRMNPDFTRAKQALVKIMQEGNK